MGQPNPEIETTLADGRRILFRRIRPDDKERLIEGLKQLSPESRYRRFFRHMDHFSEQQLRYLTEVDFVDHYALMAVLADEPGQPGVGVARWIRIAGEPTVAEAAVTVLDSYHGLGLGTTLLVLLGMSAAPRGIRAFRAWVMGDNPRMLDLLEDLGAERGKWESGVVEVTVPIPDDPGDLEHSPAPLVLRAVARGEFEGAAHPERPAATHLGEPAS